MKGNYYAARLGDAGAVAAMSKALTAWDPLLSLRVLQGAALYDGCLTSYLTAAGSCTLSFRDHRAAVNPGDAVVLPASVRIAVDPPGEFVSLRHEGLAPEHMRGPFPSRSGFEHRPLNRHQTAPSICGTRSEVIPDSDLRYRLQYHFVEIHNPKPHTHDAMTEFYYVLSGKGQIGVGPAPDQLTPVAVEPGTMLAVGPGLFHVPSDGLGLCIWFLYPEVTHRQRLRAANAVDHGTDRNACG
jgi:mannose-6-phosphate isomerase-like protein (cupin superfamily)